SDQPRTATVWHRVEARRKGQPTSLWTTRRDPGAGGWVCHLMSLRGASGDTPPGEQDPRGTGPQAAPRPAPSVELPGHRGLGVVAAVGAGADGVAQVRPERRVEALDAGDRRADARGHRAAGALGGIAGAA